MSGMQKFRYIFLITAIVVIGIGVFAAITMVFAWTPENVVSMTMLAYCWGLGTVFIFIFQRLNRGYKTTLKKLKTEDSGQEETEEPQKEGKELEY